MSVVACNRCGKYTDTDFNAEDVYFTDMDSYCLECAEEKGYLCTKCGEEVSESQRVENGKGSGICTSCINNLCA